MAVSTGSSSSQAQALEANKTSNATLNMSGVSADNSIKIGVSDDALLGLQNSFTQSLYGVASLVGGMQQDTQATIQALSANSANSNASQINALANTMNALQGNSIGAFLKNNWFYILGAIGLYMFAKKKGVI